MNKKSTENESVLVYMLPTKITDNGKKLLEETGISPIVPKDYIDDAGTNLRAAITEPLVLLPSSKPYKIPTGIAVDLKTLSKNTCELGYCLYIQISVRSGTPGYKLWNQVGVIDQQYRGELFVKLYNDTDVPIEIIPGEKIAQMITKKALITEAYVIDEFEDNTERGENGFNSTGKL